MSLNLNFLAHGLNIESIFHYLAHGLTVGWAISRESPVNDKNNIVEHHSAVPE